MEWSKRYLGNSASDPNAREIYCMEVADLPDGTSFVVGEDAGEWLVVEFDRGGGNILMSRHSNRETACREAERLYALAIGSTNSPP